MVFLRKLALVSHISSLEVAPSLVQEKNTLLTGFTARGLPRTAEQVRGFDGTEGFVTPSAMNLRRPGDSGSGSAPCWHQAWALPSSFAHLTLACFCATASGNVLGAPDLPFSFRDVSRSPLK